MRLRKTHPSSRRKEDQLSPAVSLTSRPPSRFRLLVQPRPPGHRLGHRRLLAVHLPMLAPTEIVQLRSVMHHPCQQPLASSRASSRMLSMVGGQMTSRSCPGLEIQTRGTLAWLPQPRPLPPNSNMRSYQARREQSLSRLWRRQRKGSFLR